MACGSDSPKKNLQTGTCGNGRLDGNELCDPGIESGEGACPTTCSAGACEVAELRGSPSSCDVRCVRTPIACADGDGCCPLGCDRDSDSDCTNTCGDGVVEPPELCDGNCPTTCAGDACNPGTLVGNPGACNVRCETSPVIFCEDDDGCCPSGCDASNDSDCRVTGPQCGNGVVEPGELCDGNCPTNCAPRDACEVASLQGSASQCNAACEYEPITQCQGGDGCCPAGCTAQNDSDCSATCGNGIVDPGETCDGNCPTSCTAPNACTRSTLSGSAAQCNARCVEAQITQCVSGDGCCPQGCTSANDNDCGCTPLTCAQVGATCGTPGNGCGQNLNCGQCSGTQVCTNFRCVDSPAGGLGAACMESTECGNDPTGAAYTCTTQDLALGTTFPGGYCSNLCISLLLPCPEGTCSGNIDSNGIGTCLKNCSSNGDCRTGYRCSNNTCIPN